VNDDWRIQVDSGDPGRARRLVEQLEAPDLQHDLSDSFHDRVIVSRDDARVYLYAGSREQAERACDLLRSLLAQDGASADFDLERWHPTAEDWEDPDKPLPRGNAAKAAEHARLIAAERRETEERGCPEFEVRIDLPSHHDARRFAEQLRGEGLPTVHRWKYLLIGASDEDNAKALAQRIRSEAPSGSRVSVEGTWKAVNAERPSNPFAVLGGLGG
jgi:hypothetical protein